MSIKEEYETGKSYDTDKEQMDRYASDRPSKDLGEALSRREVQRQILEQQTRPETSDEHSSPDLVNRPPHYTSHPSGVECIDITEHMGFNLGSAIKYIWRCDLKSVTVGSIVDLRKAEFYIKREIAKRTK